MGRYKKQVIFYSLYSYSICVRICLHVVKVRLGSLSKSIIFLCRRAHLYAFEAAETVCMPKSALEAMLPGAAPAGVTAAALPLLIGADTALSLGGWNIAASLLPRLNLPHALPREARRSADPVGAFFTPGHDALVLRGPSDPLRGRVSHLFAPAAPAAPSG